MGGSVSPSRDAASKTHGQWSKFMPSRVVYLAAVAIASVSIRAEAQVTFDGDWTGFGNHAQLVGPQTRLMDGKPVEWVAGYGPNEWRIMQAKDPSRIVVQQDPTSPTHGQVARIEVYPGDNVGWTGERTEVAYMLDLHGARFPVLPSSKHEYYGISIKLPEDWTPPEPDAKSGYVWGVFLQLHGPDEYHAPPAIALAAEKDFHVAVLTGDVNDSANHAHNRDATLFPFRDGSLHLGHWVEFILDAIWAYDSAGSLRIYRRDEGQEEFAVVFERAGMPTLQSSFGMPTDGKPHYWKAGYYRGICGVTSRLWLGPIVRGDDFQSVIRAAFGPIIKSLE